MDKEPSIHIESSGIEFLSTGRYYEGINQWASHKLKEGDPEVTQYAARLMSQLLPEVKNIVLVPLPGHNGFADQTLDLARAISRQSGARIANILKGRPRESNYLAKMNGHPLSEADMGFRATAKLPSNLIPILIDGVVDTGTTAKAAFYALGNRGIVLSYAMSNTLLDNEQQIHFHR